MGQDNLILRYFETGVFSVRSQILSSSFLTNLQEASPWVLPVSMRDRRLLPDKRGFREAVWVDPDREMRPAASGVVKGCTSVANTRGAEESSLLAWAFFGNAPNFAGCFEEIAQAAH